MTADGGSVDSSACFRASLDRFSPNAPTVSLVSRSTWIGPSALMPAVSTLRTARAAFAVGRSSSTDFSPATFGIHGTNAVSPSITTGPAGFFATDGFGLGAASTATDVTADRSAATPLNDSTAAVGNWMGAGTTTGTLSTDATKWSTTAAES